jgi:hypothetical protein
LDKDRCFRIRGLLGFLPKFTGKKHLRQILSEQPVLGFSSWKSIWILPKACSVCPAFNGQRPGTHTKRQAFTKSVEYCNGKVNN